MAGPKLETQRPRPHELYAKPCSQTGPHQICSSLRGGTLLANRQALPTDRPSPDLQQPLRRDPARQQTGPAHRQALTRFAAAFAAGPCSPTDRPCSQTGPHQVCSSLCGGTLLANRQAPLTDMPSPGLQQPLRRDPACWPCWLVRCPGPCRGCRRSTAAYQLPCARTSACGDVGACTQRSRMRAQLQCACACAVTARARPQTHRGMISLAREGQSGCACSEREQDMSTGFVMDKVSVSI